MSCNDLDECFESYLISTHIDSLLWHKRLRHVNCIHLEKFTRQNLDFGLPKLSFSKYAFCDACVLGKHSKTSFKVMLLVLVFPYNFYIVTYLDFL